MESNCRADVPSLTGLENLIFPFPGTHVPGYSLFRPCGTRFANSFKSHRVKLCDESRCQEPAVFGILLAVGVRLYCVARQLLRGSYANGSASDPGKSVESVQSLFPARTRSDCDASHSDFQCRHFGSELALERDCGPYGSVCRVICERSSRPAGTSTICLEA